LLIASSVSWKLADIDPSVVRRFIDVANLVAFVIVASPMLAGLVG
jgi:hypothetical protein